MLAHPSVCARVHSYQLLRSRPMRFRYTPRPGDVRDGPFTCPNFAENPQASDTMDRLLRCAGWPRESAPQTCLGTAYPLHRHISWYLPRQSHVENRFARPPLPRLSPDQRHTGASPSHSQVARVGAEARVAARLTEHQRFSKGDALVKPWGWGHQRSQRVESQLYKIVDWRGKGTRLPNAV